VWSRVWSTEAEPTETLTPLAPAPALQTGLEPFLSGHAVCQRVQKTVKKTVAKVKCRCTVPTVNNTSVTSALSLHNLTAARTSATHSYPVVTTLPTTNTTSNANTPHRHCCSLARRPSQLCRCQGQKQRH